MTTAPAATWIGADVARIEGLDKVTGRARYAADLPLADLAHGWIVQSTIVRGSVVGIDVDEALARPGVIGVLTHDNAPQLQEVDDSTLRILQDDRVRYRGDVVALVLADSLENARAAADALEVEYESEPHDVTFDPDAEAEPGEVDQALATAAVTVDATYTTPPEHNNPMEPHATTAEWRDGRLTLYESSQGPYGAQRALAELFGVARDAVRVLCDHVGGGFGSKGAPRPDAVLAAMAAQRFDRPVRVVLTRQQQFSLVGYRRRIAGASRSA